MSGRKCGVILNVRCEGLGQVKDLVSRHALHSGIGSGGGEEGEVAVAVRQKYWLKNAGVGSVES